MLEKIRQLAMEKLASEEEVNEFMKGFEKEAFLGITPAMGKRFVSGVSTNAGKAAASLGAALIGAAIVKGVSSSSSAAGTYFLRNKFDMSLAQVMATNRVVKGAKPEKAREYAETLFHFAPHVASDPNLLSSILANAVLGEGIDPMTIKNLVDLEGRYVDNNNTKPFPGIRI